MKFKLSDKTSRFAKRTLADFSERMIVMLASLRAFMKKQIGQIISKCPGTKDFPVREDVMVDYYAATLEMLLEKCFFTKRTAKQRGSITSSPISAWQCGKGGS